MSKSYDEKVSDALELLGLHVKGKDLHVSLAFSHQNEDAIALSLALQAGINVSVFTLDTYKLFEQSLAYQKEIEAFFDVTIQAFSAHGEAIKALEAKVGEWGIFDDINLRKECCHVRKLLPLKEALKGKDGWISGIRAAQSITRSETVMQEFDTVHQMQKFNPLAFFSDADVARYMQEHHIPQNALYAKGFQSIGCSCCTRAIAEGEDIRAGRWWWENPEHKECGLHVK
ncbi:phosphoadenylyl-sulfate reductase [Sulfuricurvum sp.]|uniref:phosphoadenylyl-sulfate reductase n=1 Tax=Sulfuricurvum sp. TaxID=2025608 RepID=UPI00261EC63F|nr:phosphoadenylyl-sulfate reductase [Sulfuricurvum sp.]MDD2267905.1 phosphoadenylyl-sulfate reductase [Sulfuricurvum sp.]